MIEQRTTKKLLADSFIDLARKKTIERITVSEIVRNCGAGRQTFYNHFQSKYDLIYWICDETADEILNQWIGKEPWGKSLGRVLLHMQTIRHFYARAFRQNDYMQLYEHFYNYCARYYGNYIRTVCCVSELDSTLEFEIKYTSYACVNIAKDWIEGSFASTAEETGFMLYNAMSPHLKRYFDFTQLHSLG